MLSPPLGYELTDLYLNDSLRSERPKGHTQSEIIFLLVEIRTARAISIGNHMISSAIWNK